MISFKGRILPIFVFVRADFLKKINRSRRKMNNETFVPDNIPADLDKSWHIPRPTLARNSRSSQGSTSSNNSTQSARSGSLLLTAANLAQIHQLQEQERHEDNPRPPPGGAVTCANTNNNLSTRDQNIQYYLQTTGQDDRLAVFKKLDPDTVSVASSMHFTVVNVNTRQAPPKRSCCRKHQLTILVTTMSALFTLGILTAIFLLEMRAKNQRY